MYNRYIPQPDGTYRRNSIQETHTPAQQREEPCQNPPQTRPTQEPQAPPCQNCVHSQPPQRRPAPPRPRKNTPPSGIGTFLKQLLPKDFDTEDLIIVLLLLLMAGDCQEDQNSALLTLVLYLFL